MIDKHLLSATNLEAPCFCVYGGPGLKKSHAVHSLPPPILVHQFDQGGSASYLPWIRRIRTSDPAAKWHDYNQADRESWATLVNTEKVTPSTIKPSAYVDVITYDITSPATFDHFKSNVGNFDFQEYNSEVIDSLQELSFDVRTYTKGMKGKDINTLMGEIAFSWSQAQERTQIALRSLGGRRRQGVFVYMIGAQTIAKDYVKNPFEKKEKGEGDAEAYNIQGTVDLPGQLANSIGHGPDLLLHARLMSIDGKEQPIWISEPEMLPGGSAWWDAKDRYGRLKKLCWPNFRSIMDQLYGVEGRKAIYGAARIAQVAAIGNA